MKVCHMTSAHNCHDIRIFVKECCSLAQAGYDIYLVAMGESEEKSSVHIVGAGPIPTSRRKRMTATAKRVYLKALDLDCSIYHFHDPELLPYGLKLKKAGAYVIFDSHEDVPAQILDKQWIPAPLRKVTACLYRRYETHVVKQLDAVVAATPYIAKQFEGRAQRVVVVNNYPKLDDIQFHDTAFEQREPIICYAGGISELRGEKVMVEAMKDVEGTLVLAGPRENKNVEVQVPCDSSQSPEARREKGTVNYVGKLTRKQVNELYGNSRAGIVLYQPAANHYESQPIKMFEFMAAGLPVIASNFPLWKKIIEENECGICVDPTNVLEARNACTKLLRNPDLAQEMGMNGRKAVVDSFNWAVEEKKLLDLYQCL